MQMGFRSIVMGSRYWTTTSIVVLPMTPIDNPAWTFGQENQKGNWKLFLKIKAQRRSEVIFLE